MPVLVYSPAVEVFIDTVKYGVIDVTEDISAGRLVLATGRPHTLNVSLLNRARKYDSMFRPNDRVIVRMKRLKWLLTFSGYLDTVPVFSVHSRSVRLEASCTIKKLQFRNWDPGLIQSFNLLNVGLPDDINKRTDGGLALRARRFLTEVCGWPDDHVHISEIPSAWFEKVADLWDKVGDRIGAHMNEVGSAAVIAGQPVVPKGDSVVQGINRLTGQLPATSGKISMFAQEAGGSFALTAPESPRNPVDLYYVAMRFPYAIDTGTKPSHQKLAGTQSEVGAAMGWWANRKLLVTNPKNGRSCVVRAASWGPAAWTGRVIDAGPGVMRALGANTDDTVQIAFAPTGMSVGPVTSTQPIQGPPNPNVSGAALGHPDSASATNPPPPTVTAASGVRFTSAEHLKPNVYAAETFIKATWSVPKGIGGYASSGHTKNSDHYKGQALDVMVSKGAAKGADKALGNAVAQWFLANPKAFGLKYVIWYGKINTGSGWRTYTTYASQPNNDTLQHRDHVHLSFQDTGQTSVGPMGGGWPGSTVEEMRTLFGDLDAATASPGDGTGDPLLNTSQWMQTISASTLESNILSGPRALMNDEPVLPTLGMILNASMREFCSAPNGDFMAWFPDWFGAYGTAAKMVVEDIELQDFTVDWTDQFLKTHWFASGASTGFNTLGAPGGEDADAIFQKYATTGIASVEFPEIMEALFNITPGNDPYGFLDAAAFLQRNGARPEFEAMQTITDPKAVFWYALHQFQKNWAEQFQATVPLTFMPELWPGMLLQIPKVGGEPVKFQAYIQAVTHDFSFTDGRGFSTNAVICAPSVIDGSSLYALARAGQ